MELRGFSVNEAIDLMNAGALAYYHAADGDGWEVIILEVLTDEEGDYARISWVDNTEGETIHSTSDLAFLSRV